MSHIFDALQRSDSDSSTKKGQAAESAATELLERAERQAASQWKSEAGTADLANVEASEAEFSSGLRTAVPAASANVLLSGEGVPSVERDKMFSQFQTREVSPSEDSQLVCLLDRESPAAEAFHLLKVRLRHMRKDGPLKKVAITSTAPQEGKSFAAANLACVLAAGTQHRTLLIEGDVRRPTLSQLFGLDDTCGLCEYIQGQQDLAASIYRLEGPGIWLLPAGKAAGDPQETIQSAQLPVLMQQVASWFDWIIIDCPPVLPLADTSTWARLADGILLVTRRETTKRRRLERGLDAIEPDKLIGAVLNSSNSTRDKDYYYYRYGAKGRERTEATTV